VTNFFDRDPILSRQGKFEEFRGDSSEIAVDEAVKFIRAQVRAGKPTFTVIWYGTPHSPMRAAAEDKTAFAALEPYSADHYGELVAMDRSIGTLRRALREIGIADNTLLWFNSDNGGLPEVKPDTVGGLRGFKGTVYEGGLRVPGIVEWPARIQPRVTSYPAGTVDIFPTVAAAVGLPAGVTMATIDGANLLPVFAQETGPRTKPLGFRHQRRGAWIDQRYKLVCPNVPAVPAKYELYDLEADPKESRDLAAERPDVLARLRGAFEAWNASVQASADGRDYPEGRVDPQHPPSRDWTAAPEYAAYLPQWKERVEFRAYLERAAKGGKKKQ
jgi:arylsulfatase A-like enzyme